MGTAIAFILSGLYGAGIYLWGYFSGKKEGYRIGYSTGLMCGMQRSKLFTFGKHEVVEEKIEEESGAE